MNATTFDPAPVHHPPAHNLPPLIEVRGLDLWYGARQVLHQVEFDLFPSEILAFIGPSGCGKTTTLKVLNRMHDEVRDLKLRGRVLMHGKDIYAPDIDPPLHRRRFGWVAQRPDPFPLSIYDNVAYGPSIHGLTANAAELADHVEKCLRRADLWDEVKDDLHRKSGLELSLGQQQRLCIARALSNKPEVLLMDEPTGSIDPIATERVERLLLDLKSDHAIVLITHSMAEARRIADRVAVFHMGWLVESGPVSAVFNRPATPEARAFLAGRTG